MTVSIFDLFSIGIGPSSSHTIGPMRAARRFLTCLQSDKGLQLTQSIKVELFGSLALTGKGHRTDVAVLLGLEGERPENVDPDSVDEKINRIRDCQQINLLQLHRIPFKEKRHLLYHKHKRLPFHSNTLRFTAYDKDSRELYSEVFYSIGGGFILDHSEMVHGAEMQSEEDVMTPFPFKTAKGLLTLCREQKMSIAQIMLENEKIHRHISEIYHDLLHIWSVMKDCVDRGCRMEGILPGGLNVPRRAASIYQSLNPQFGEVNYNFADVFDWVSLWALSVNEENAAGGRVVTTPTNGAAGIIPSVLLYFLNFISKQAQDEDIINFLLTAGAIGILFKTGASISAAEMGCQGEVGVACSMAAAGLAAVMGGTPEQIENAAEIGIEHNLGLTCDPVAGLVQIPCIERNTMGAIKAINAAHLALRGNGQHHVSLDAAIKTMNEVGHEMNSIYKETSLGGLAVNVAGC
ncbi:MAG: L-serine ammonia-lyase [Chlamydiales bacterium]